MCEFSREALGQDPPDVAAVRATWVRLHGPASAGLGVRRAAGEATDGLDAAQWRVVFGGFRLHAYRDSAITEFLRPPAEV